MSPTTPPRLTVGTTIAQPVSVWNPLQPLIQQLPRPLLSQAPTQLTHQDAIIGYVILSSNLVVWDGLKLMTFATPCAYRFLNSQTA